MQELGTWTKAYKLDKLASNDVFHEVDGVDIGVLDLTEDKHLWKGGSREHPHVRTEKAHHLGYFLRILVLPIRISLAPSASI